FEIAEQQQPKVPARRQPWSPHHWRVERLTLLLGEPIEAGLVEDGVQSRVERMAGRDGELGGRNPDRPLLALAFAHRHGPQFTVSPAARPRRSLRCNRPATGEGQGNQWNSHGPAQPVAKSLRGALALTCRSTRMHATDGRRATGARRAA